jgi:O-antigen ligase/tetratricopeptide (TPR) repeat protein
MARLGAWVAIAVLTLYVAFIGGGWYGIYAPTLRATTVTLAAVALIAWALVAWRRPAWRPRSALLPAIVLCLASLVLSTALSKHPRFGIEYVGYAIVLGALYLLLVQILRERFFRARMVTLVVGMFVAVSALFLVLVVGHWLELWSLVGHVTFPPLRPKSESLTYGNPSAVMTMAFLLACSSAAAVGAFSTPRRIVLLVGVVTVGAVTLLSGSRSGWFAVGLAVVMTAGVAMAVGRNRDRIRSLAATVRRSKTGLAGTGVLVLGVAFIGVAVGPAIIRRLTEGGETLRIGYAVAAMRMFLESPVVGLGPGMWVANRIRETSPPETDYYIPHAHDIYLQTLAELGVVGAIAGAVLVVSLFWLIRGAVTDPDAYRRRWGWAACLAILYFGVHQVLDFYANMPAILLAAAIPVAWLDATAEPAHGPLSHPGSRSLAIGVVAVAIAVAGLLYVEGPATEHSDAVTKANEGHWADSLGPARAAVQADPEWPPYQITFGLAATRADDHSAAMQAFRSAAQSDDQPESWLNLAAEQALMDDHDGALDSVVRAMRLGYQRSAVSGAAGDLLLRLGDTAGAADAFAWAISVTPSWAGDPWWQADPDRAAIYDAVIGDAIARAPVANRWEIAAMSGDFERAHALVSGLDPASAEIASTVLDALKGDEAAEASLVRACDSQPVTSSPLLWCARIAAFRGDEVQANRYRAWGFVIGTGYQAMAELRVNDKPVIGRTAEGDLALFYGLYTYRRPTPWDLLGPSLIHFTVK